MKQPRDPSFENPRAAPLSGPTRIPGPIEQEPKDGSDWQVWLASRRELAFQVYALKPEQLIADYRRERAITRDYEDREILELLQNASDAAKTANEFGRVYIELSATGLIVANTGESFTRGGVISLQTADLSPKRDGKKSLIGSKGLGFRSILNWTRQPIILSGSLQLAYSLTHAAMAIEALASKTPEVARAIEKEASVGNSPVPLLPFPMWLEDLSDSLDPNIHTLHERCQSLRNSGYMTVIGMPFDRKEAFENALIQLRELQPEFLLFSEAICELTVCCDQLEPTSWFREEESLERVVLKLAVGDVSSRTRWRLFKKCGEIPANLLRDEADLNAFSIVVALPEDGLAKPANLYSFFPTSIQLPLPVLCHATLELEQNRKRLQQIAANKYVLSEVANLILEIAQLISSGDDNQWRGIDILKTRRDFPLDLSTLESQLIKGAASKKIIPTLSGHVVKPEDAFGLPGATVDWLPVRSFGSVAAARDSSDLTLFRRLGMLDLCVEDFKQRIRCLSNPSIIERASLVVGIIRNRLPPDYHYAAILIDSGGQCINNDDRVFLPGEHSGRHKSLPIWARVKVLNGELWEEISFRLDTARVRDTRRLLESFGVQEYALGNLIRGLVSSSNRVINEIPTTEDDLRRELLAMLFDLFPAELSKEKRPSFPDNVTVLVPNQASGWSSADQTYIGAGYSIFGTVMQELLARHPEKLMIGPGCLSVSSGVPSLLGEFLVWVGVQEWPREVEIKYVPQKFVEYALQRIEYPAVFEDGFVYQSSTEIERPRFERVISLDQFDSILTAKPVAVLAWLAHDHRAARWSHFAKQNGRLNCLPASKQHTRRFLGEVPSYIHWLIKTTNWLPDSFDHPVAPTDCMLGDKSLEGIFPRPQRPSVADLRHFSLNGQDLQIALLRAGVPAGLSNLDSEDIYALLRELPARSPDGKAAKRLYRWLLESSDLAPDVEGSNYQMFATRGKIWARSRDREGYYPVKEALHVDVEGLPTALLENLIIADLPKKRGAEKISRLFALKAIDRMAVAEQVEHHVVAPCAHSADARLQECKPYIRALRQSQSSQPQQLELLARLRLEVSIEITAVVRYGGQSIHHRIRPWGYAIQDNILYVACEPSRPADVSPALLANVVGDATASIFGLSDGSAFAQIFQCDEMDRKCLLMRLLGEEQDGDVKDLLAAEGQEDLENQLTIILPFESMPFNDQTEDEESIDVNSTIISEISDSQFTPIPISVSGVGVWTTPDNINIEPVPHVATLARRHIDIKVTPPGSRGLSAQAWATYGVRADGEIGELLAVMFEQHAGRHPLRVGHITGYLAPGCDVLSFRSSEERDEFLSGQQRNSALVDRFIEAKARSGGTVELSGHEWNAARQWGSRYFIYRFERDNEHPSDYLLTVLSDPQTAVEAQIPVIQLSLDRALRAERYRINRAPANPVPVKVLFDE